MNDTFNFNRFYQYSKTRLFSQKFFYLSPFFIVGFSIFTIILDLVFDNMTGISLVTFWGFCCAAPFFGSLIFYASRTFSDFQNRGRGFIIATLPVSNFEKFLFGFFQNVILFTFLYSVTFFISALLVIGYNSIIPYGHKEVFETLVTFKNLNNFNDAPLPIPFNFLTLINEILAISVIYSLGSIVFKRVGFIFTSLIFMGTLLLSMNILGVIVCGHAWGCTETVEFAFAPFNNSITEHHIYKVLGLSAFYVSVILLWLASFYRIKEKEF